MEEKEVKNNSETISIIGFITSFLIPIVGLILSIIGLNKSKKNNSSSGLAIAGVIISILGIIFRIVIILLAFFSFINIIPTAGKYIDSAVDKMCDKVERCEETFGSFYTCHYSKDNVEYTITCPEEKIPEGIIDKKDEQADLDNIKQLAIDYYMYKYDGVYEKAEAAIISNNVVIDIYSTNNLLALTVTVDKDTLIGKDSNNYYVDLNNIRDEKDVDI